METLIINTCFRQKGIQWKLLDNPGCLRWGKILLNEWFIHSNDTNSLSSFSLYLFSFFPICCSAIEVVVCCVVVLKCCLKYIILLHLCQENAQTPSLGISKSVPQYSEQQVLYALLNRKALTNLILRNVHSACVCLCSRTSWKCGCNSKVVFSYPTLLARWLIVWFGIFFAGGIQNRIAQLLSPWVTLC